MNKKTPEQLRSHRWFSGENLRAFTHRSRAKQMGYALDDFAGKPVIAIVNTWSDLTTCHSHFRTRAEEVKRGVWQAGGFPVELPAMPVNETFMKPSPMMYRNFLAMETEELLRSQPIDGVVLMGGCDKTTPGLLMGAISMNLPAIFLPAGPMLRGNWCGQPLASGTDVWKYWNEKRAGRIDDQAWAEIEDGIARSFGTCMTMGTASTMASVTEGMGIAMAGRAGISFGLDDFDRLSRSTPVLANIRPVGEFLMEDFHYAGGLGALMNEIPELLYLGADTVNGRTLGENMAGAEVFNDQVIRRRDRALSPEGGVSVLRGNLAPDGAVIKHTAAEPRLLRHEGPAVVFRDYNDMAARIDDPALEVTADSVLVLQHAGPIGGPGMPEWGMLPIPKKLLAAGVRDMVRVSDARMSGTAYGACVLHVAPESFVGGPLAFVRDGDRIALDVPARRLSLQVGDDELARRRAAWTPPQTIYPRGYGWLYSRHITQADQGCDFDFLAAE